jgi:hypothetical protein
MSLFTDIGGGDGQKTQDWRKLGRRKAIARVLRKTKTKKQLFESVSFE